MRDSENPYEPPREPGEARREASPRTLSQGKTLVQVAIGIVLGAGIAQAALGLLDWLRE